MNMNLPYCLGPKQYWLYLNSSADILSLQVSETSRRVREGVRKGKRVSCFPPIIFLRKNSVPAPQPSISSFQKEIQVLPQLESGKSKEVTQLNNHAHSRHSFIMGASSSKYKHVTKDFELVIRSSRDLEYVLDTQFGARGKGLHEKITSVEQSLPQQLIRNMRYLATIRNKLVHEQGFDRIPERERFILMFDQSTVDLQKAVEDRKRLAQGYMQDRDQASACVVC